MLTKNRFLVVLFTAALLLTFGVFHVLQAGDKSGALLLEDAFTSIAENTFPSVVVISGRRHIQRMGQDGIQPDFPFQLPPEVERQLRERFDQRQRPMPHDRRHFAEGRGSGFFIDSKGHILTNNHVVAGNDVLMVKLRDGREFEASLVGADPKSDLAVIKIESENTEFPFLEFADSEKIRVGQWAIAIGAPFNFDYTMTVGIVSQTGRSVGLNVYENYIQTDASINPGNSGGPLLDIHGKVIGVNNFIVSSSPFAPGNAGLGFAIPANMATEVMAQLISHGEVVRPWIGISMQSLTPQMKRQFGAERGVLVGEVMKDNPADEGGIQPGDVILKIDGVEMEQPKDVQFAILKRNPGETIRVAVSRDGGELELDVVAGKQKSDGMALEPPGDTGEGISGLEPFGISLRETEGGLQISDVRQGSPAMLHGLRPGTTVYSINRKKVTTVEDAEKAAGTNNLQMLLHLSDGKTRKFMVIER